MKLTNRVKPISYLKANATEIIRELGEGAEPLVITQRGEAKAVLVDLAEYEATLETLALLEMLAAGEAEYEAGRYSPASEVFQRIRGRAKKRK
ncbi:Phd_YefM protein [Variibacter gotjawalensis]|uniref:Antitoxin n=1 Tax=Variibacter gotjawalensis TaxID=1333996 RepID=A0A0S3PR70_9BRAD|nr:type II toxin-antitoxin system Phd/YefM family antitoxin [Variibacter gotjawalensis]NIK48742.1 prevent-host-death family protein [Variibacter gotjawalensis]RZS50603.1 prevent-host-death family protein [Variibacter gotjawalensis]BAT58437.1 Phd_YefM protein [Variibacter gotjawalensis]